MQNASVFKGLRHIAKKITRQLPTLPHTYACSTIGSTGLNFSVRNGKRCDPCDSVTEHEHRYNKPMDSSMVYKRYVYLYVFFNTPSHKEAHVTCRVILHELFSLLLLQSREKSEPLKGACDTAVISL